MRARWIGIGARLSAGFVLIVVLILLLALFSVHVSQQSLQESVGNGSIFLADEMLKSINHGIYDKIESLQGYGRDLMLQRALLASNSEFDELENIAEYVYESDREWASAPKDEITPFMRRLIDNDVSIELRGRFVELEEKYGYQAFVEVLATNRYGANVAQTGKTSDYRQDDEAWWQIARDRGLYVGDVERDESTGTNAIIIGVRVDDEEGNFIGVVGATVAAAGIIREAEIATRKYETTEIQLLTQDGRLIYATKPFQFLEDVSGQPFFAKIKSNSGFFVAEEAGRNKLFSYARSRGHRDFAGLGWVLVMAHDVKEVLGPILLLRNSIAIAAIVLILVSSAVALLIARSIALPIRRLTRAAEDISGGQLGIKIDTRILSANDEVGDLARAFDHMARSLEQREREASNHTEALEASERALRESRELNESIVQTMSEGIVVEDDEGYFTFVNPAAAELLGYAPEELVGQHWTTVTPTDQWAIVEEANERRRHGRGDRYELETVHRDGRRIPITISGSPRFEGEGLVGTLAVFTDITERKRAEQLLDSLNQAALAMARALTPDEVFRAAGEAFERIDFACAIFLTGEDQSTLSPKHLSHRSKVIRAAEKLTGLKIEDFSITIEATELYRRVIRDGQSVFVKDAEEAARQVLPTPVKPLSRQLIRVLNVSRFVAAPLIAEDKVIGAITVLSDALVEDDVPTITAFAHQVAAAWRKAQLYAQAQQEIAERVRAEEGQRQALAQVLETTRALRESERFLKDVFDAIRDGINVLDRELNVVRVNPWLEEMYASEMPLVGKKCYAAFQKRSSSCPWCPSVPTLETGEPHTKVVPVGSLENPAAWREISAFPLKDTEGRVTGVIEYTKDITKRKQAEAEREQLLVQVQEQARQMQQIVDTVPEGMLLLDASRQVILANPAAERELVALSSTQVGDTLTHLGDQPLDQLLTSPPQGLWHEVAADNRTFEAIARPLETGPTSEGWVLVIRDVTQEREIQQYTRQQERLAAVGQLAAGIAHDFNNIMATIVLYTQMTAQVEGLSSRDRKRLATVDQQAQHATRLIRQILDFSRRSVLERRPLDLTMLLKEHVQLLRRTLPENIEIKLSHGPDEYTINADLTRMQQMITNLALNARDAMPEGGTLHISLERIEVRDHDRAPMPNTKAGSWVQITVSDTGTGIPPDDLPYIFEPFFTTKAPGRGSGLGLSQVYGIVGQHEGHIDVASQQNQGTRFTIYLPALPIHPPARPILEPAAMAKGRGETILVVEDDPIARATLTDSLQLLNYRTLAAANGQEALAILEQQRSAADDQAHQIALVLSDVVMPGMGGIPLLRSMYERGMRVPVVLLTGHPLAREMENLRAEDAASLLVDWLPKPPSLEQLAELVARGLQG